MKYSEMALEQMGEWGKIEGNIRKKELLDCNSQEGLEKIQRDCNVRRKLIGASRGEATQMIALAFTKEEHSCETWEHAWNIRNNRF